MKKKFLQTQLLISIGYLTLTPLTFLQSANDDIAAISTALMAGWRNAKKNSDVEATTLLTSAIDTFTSLQETQKTAFKKQQETINEQSEAIALLKIKLEETEKKVGVATKNAATQAQEQIQTIATQKDALWRELQALQDDNNKLRNQIALMQHVVTHVAPAPNGAPIGG